jgi:hypothetical protein
VRKKKERGKRKVLILSSFTSLVQKKEKNKQKLEPPDLIYSTMHMYKKMICNICSLYFIVIFFGTINALPRYRYRRQVNLPQNNVPSDERISARYPTGSIMGTYYYGDYNFHRLLSFVFIFLFYI